MQARAVICRALSDDIGSVKLETVQVPDPGPGQIRVRRREWRMTFLSD